MNTNKQLKEKNVGMEMDLTGADLRNVKTDPNAFDLTGVDLSNVSVAIALNAFNQR